MNQMIQTFRNAWKIADIRKKILFTLFIVLIYRVGANLYVPFVDTDQLLFVKTYQNAMSAGIFQLVNMFSGGAFEQATLFALSVSPYITASIVMQLLTIAIPYLENLSKEGEEGKKKINAYTRGVTAILALITAFGYVTMLNSYGCLAVSKSDGALYYFAYVVMIACFCAGAAIIMWMAERINERGIGNGISIILFANIISRGSTMVTALIALLKNANGQFLTGWKLALGILWIILFVAVSVAVVGLIVWFTNSEERIRIQYAKKVVGRKMYGGQTSNLPLKMNMAGVMPIIFASSIVSILPTVANFFGESNGFRKFVTNYLGTNTPVYIFLYLVFLFLFSYFYIMISFNPVEVANNIQNNGGSIKGYRPGAETANYIKRHLNRITAIGAVFLSVIACVPMIIGVFVTNSAVSTLLTFGGSSLLIVVGVALETVRSVEAQMKLRNYKGFLD
jgi:preprotein translocase, secY subunit